jgi:hypothetical protein
MINSLTAADKRKENATMLEKTSWDILREPNRILLEEDYTSRMEMLIYLLTWSVQIGLTFVLAISYLRG